MERSSDAGVLLLGQADAVVGLVDRLAACFEDHRDGRFVEHSVRTLVGRRVFGIALGYEDLVDHDVLRGDPMMAVLAGKLRAKHRNCAPVAGESTLNRLELGGLSPSGDCKIVHDGSAIADLLAAPPAAAHRSIRSMAREAGLSPATGRRIRKTSGLQPHRSETFELSSGPPFVDKARDIVGLYLASPDRAGALPR